MTTETMLVLIMEYQILLNILSTSWLVWPPPLLGSSVVGGFADVSPPGVVIGVTGGIVGSGGIGGSGLGGHGPGSGIVLFGPVIKQYMLKYSSFISLKSKMEMVIKYFHYK